MLDTRNDYEVDAGTFDNTAYHRVGMFSVFSSRCGRASRQPCRKNHCILLHRRYPLRKGRNPHEGTGIERVYQLEGGILKYFEEVGGARYRGDRSVFDEREALSADLQPATGRLCW